MIINITIIVLHIIVLHYITIIVLHYNILYTRYIIYNILYILYYVFINIIISNAFIIMYIYLLQQHSSAWYRLNTCHKLQSVLPCSSLLSDLPETRKDRRQTRVCIVVYPICYFCSTISQYSPALFLRLYLRSILYSHLYLRFIYDCIQVNFLLACLFVYLLAMMGRRWYFRIK